ncbi:hypothetical protein LLS1_23740 [Leifsonia sp. LS1]|uniref:DUF4190 domain-containing protein n=1 Tax=Leifsonia sp. LS1 TaxID=2828483 RepID=UPI001CFC4F61|nr:DUF4190 domain-containing protein [Leifsonia sp. LS1]GIT80705.1 hypothetical protein LLS1_23740 [Leifsonia sp. LS1]
MTDQNAQEPQGRPQYQPQNGTGQAGYAPPVPPAPQGYPSQPGYPPQPGYPAQPVQPAQPVHPAYVAAYGVAVYPVAPPEPKGLSIASMVLGLVSLVAGFTFVVPLIGLILGIVGVRREPAGRGMAVTGIVISSLILLVWVVIIGMILFAGLLAAGGAATYRSA